MIGSAIGMVIWALITAYQEADNDASRIARHLPINHARNLVRRVVIVGAGYVALCGMTKDWWSFLLLAPMAWAAFTPAFRYILNSKRNLPHWYMARSNFYDSLWLAWAIARTDDEVELAGLTAYRVEGFILGSSWAAIILYALCK